jgi:hypothetical protein
MGLMYEPAFAGVEAGSDHRAPGPVFVSGRQFSGNSVTTKILMQAPGCLGFIADNGYWEFLHVIDRIGDPRARVERAIEGMRFVENPNLGREVRRHLPRWIDEHPDANALAIYLEAMRHCMRVSGAACWLQKATSYIFYADEILTALPDAKMIYLMRNPYDLLASTKRRYLERHWTRDRILGILMGWNKGVRLAQRMERTYPDRFRIVPYEALVTDPEGMLPKLFEFVGYEYQPTFVHVPRINTSDNQMDFDGRPTDTARGLSGFHINYYMNVLTPGEKRAADMLLSRSLVNALYPDLPHRAGRASLGASIRALGVLALNAVRFAGFQCSRFKGVPGRGRFVFERSLKRLRA